MMRNENVYVVTGDDQCKMKKKMSPKKPPNCSQEAPKAKSFFGWPRDGGWMEVDGGGGNGWIDWKESTSRLDR
jgi:hypothetical protein